MLTTRPPLIPRKSDRFPSCGKPSLVQSVEYVYQPKGSCHLCLLGGNARVHAFVVVEKLSAEFRSQVTTPPRDQPMDCTFVVFLRLHRFRRAVTFSGNSARESGGAFAVLSGELTRK